MLFKSIGIIVINLCLKKLGNIFRYYHLSFTITNTTILLLVIDHLWINK